jgi:hypothetical protein
VVDVLANQYSSSVVVIDQVSIDVEVALRRGAVCIEMDSCVVASALNVVVIMNLVVADYYIVISR